MKKPLIIAAALFSITSIVSCQKKEVAPAPTPAPIAQATPLPLSGSYLWKFEIPGVGQQESQLVFYPDSVQYLMQGPALTTNYMMTKDSYTENNSEKRWIGIGKGGSIPKDGVWFVMFFKDITDSSVTIYKRECAKGKEEAESLAYPDANTTADRGWNVYYKK